MSPGRTQRQIAVKPAGKFAGGSLFTHLPTRIPASIRDWLGPRPRPCVPSLLGMLCGSDWKAGASPSSPTAAAQPPPGDTPPGAQLGRSLLPPDSRGDGGGDGREKRLYSVPHRGAAGQPLQQPQTFLVVVVDLALLVAPFTHHHRQRLQALQDERQLGVLGKVGWRGHAA